MSLVPNSGFEREMTCRSWGQYNFETFDGLYYYFPGRCTYTLLRDCEETTQPSIVVQVSLEPPVEESLWTGLDLLLSDFCQVQLQPEEKL